MTVASPPGQEEPPTGRARLGALVPLASGTGVGAFGLLNTQAVPGWGLVLVLLAALAVVGLRSVLPQRSCDRLEWWRDRRWHQERLRGLRRTPGYPMRTTQVPAAERKSSQENRWLRGQWS